MNRVKVDVCGQTYHVSKETIENGPPSRLKRIYNSGSTESKSECILIDRTPESFAAILAFYQNGELHIPMTACPGAFMAELEYWEISPEALSECCYNRLQKFLDEQETLNSFNQMHLKSKEGHSKGKRSKTCLQRHRANIWDIINYTRPSVVGKIYSLITLIMVLVSIFVLAYSTDPSFNRELTNCERLEYIDSTGIEGYDSIKPYLEELCTFGDVPELSQSLIEKLNLSDVENVVVKEENHEGDEDSKSLMITFIRKQLILLTDEIELKEIEEPDKIDNPFQGLLADFVPNNDTTATEKNLSLVKNNLVFEEPIIQDTHLKTLKQIPVAQTFTNQKDFLIPSIKIKMFILIILEGITTIFFTIEFLLRLSTCPNIKVYFLSLIDCADAVSLLGSYLYFCLYLLYPQLRYNSWINYLAYLQSLRSLRFFRLVMNMQAGIVLAYSVRRNIKDLAILVLFLFAGMCTFGSCIYIAEDNESIKSIPDAWYLSIITMTTVGYGELHPQTNVGRFVCCLCAVTGVLLLALTVPMFANHFLMLYNHIETDNVVERYRKRNRKQLPKKE